MSVEIEIDGGKDETAYKIIVTGRDLETFLKASEYPKVRGKTGEALVQALLAVAKRDITSISRYKDGKLNETGLGGEPAQQIFYNSGEMYEVTRYRNGKVNDGAKGEPAKQFMHRNGKLTDEERYQDGKRNDGAKGEPAFLRFNESGAPKEVYRFKEGLMHDGPNGEPAHQYFYNNGILKDVVRYTSGKRSDGPNGEPAVQQFDEQGRLNSATRYSDGLIIQELGSPEIAEYLASLKDNQTIASITAANPAMKVVRRTPKP